MSSEDVRHQYEVICSKQFAEIKKGQEESQKLMREVRERVFNGLTDKMVETRKEIHGLRKTFIWFIVVVGLGIATLLVQAFVF
jgi:hypothetical protein